MSSEIHYATGRRKTSSARVYLKKGKVVSLLMTENLMSILVEK
jgi:ribosomal protein S9